MVQNLLCVHGIFTTRIFFEQKANAASNWVSKLDLSSSKVANTNNNPHSQQGTSLEQQ